MNSSDRLTALDATFLELEQADRSAHMHIGGLITFDAMPGAGAPSLEAVCELLDRRLDAVPRFRQRLSNTVTGRLRWPAWERDPGFDLAGNVRRAALPRPGGDAELLEWAGDFYSHRLDRGRPLWEIVLLEGLEGGRWALCTKTHHCLVDGVGSLDVADLLLDAAPEPGAAERAPAGAVLEARGHRVRVRALRDSPVPAAQAAMELAWHPDRALEALERLRAVAELLVRNELIAAPRTSLNLPIGEHRRLAVVRARLDELKAIKRSLGGTVNDVVLAGVTGGLRKLLLARGEQPPRAGLRAMVPVNVRPAGERLALGNRISSLFVHLPVAAADPLERYELVKREAEAAKAGSQAVGSATLLGQAALAPPVLHSGVARSLFATRLFNVTVTNVPGPQMTLYAFGTPLREIIPLVPLAAEHPLGIAVLSYHGGVVFGLNCDRETVPDAATLAAGIHSTLEQLAAVARRVASAERERAAVDE